MPHRLCTDRIIFLLLRAEWYVPAYGRNVCCYRATGKSPCYCQHLLSPCFCFRMCCRLLVWMGNRPVAVQEKRLKIFPAEIPESCRRRDQATGKLGPPTTGKTGQRGVPRLWDGPSRRTYMSTTFAARSIPISDDRRTNGAVRLNRAVRFQNARRSCPGASFAFVVARAWDLPDGRFRAVRVRSFKTCSPVSIAALVSKPTVFR